MLDIYPPAKRGAAMAIWGMGVMLGPIMGPTLGGWLTDNYSWRWVFFVNLPFGILTVLGLSVFMTESAIRRDVPFAWFGFLSLSLGIGALADDARSRRRTRAGSIRARSSSRRCWRSSASISSSSIRFTSKRPFIPLRIFRDWNFSIARDLHVPDRHHSARHDGAGDALPAEPDGLSGAGERLSPRHARHRHVRRDDDGRPPARQDRRAPPDLLRADPVDGVAVGDGRLDAGQFRARDRHRLGRPGLRPRLRFRAAQHDRFRHPARRAAHRRRGVCGR